jgi:hypothetical protein
MHVCASTCIVIGLLTTVLAMPQPFFTSHTCTPLLRYGYGLQILLAIEIANIPFLTEARSG